MDESIKRDAYLKGLKLKNTGLDEGTIMIRLEKQGISSELAREVAKNVFLQRQIDSLNAAQAPSFFASKNSLFVQLFHEINFLFKSNKK